MASPLAAPRRVRGFLGGVAVFDTDRALYVWEWPYYPQYYLPSGDIRMDLLHAEGVVEQTPRGEVHLHAVRAGGQARPRAARLLPSSPLEGLSGTVRFEWAALDQWFEEDEEVWVHPRSPYVRVDALRSTRTVRIELDGVVLAESPAPVMVFETGLPTRYYVDRGAVHFEHLVPSATRTACPYKGRTTGYWSALVGGATVPDVAWLYDFPTRQLAPVAGMVAFLNERVDVWVDGLPQARPITHMT